jgi:hypothetical protein
MREMLGRHGRRTLSRTLPPARSSPPEILQAYGGPLVGPTSLEALGRPSIGPISGLLPGQGGFKHEAGTPNSLGPRCDSSVHLLPAAAGSLPCSPVKPEPLGNAPLPSPFCAPAAAAGAIAAILAAGTSFSGEVGQAGVDQGKRSQEPSVPAPDLAALTLERAATGGQGDLPADAGRSEPAGPVPDAIRITVVGPSGARGRPRRSVGGSEGGFKKRSSCPMLLGQALSEEPYVGTEEAARARAELVATFLPQL